MAKHSAKRIAERANTLSQDVPQHLSAASGYVEQYAELPGTAFGILPQIFLSGPYNDAWSTQLQNLKDGKTTFDSILDGMWQVAKNFDAVEVANTVRKQDKKPGELKKPDTSGSTGDAVAQATAWATVKIMADLWIVSAGVKAGISTQCMLGFLSAVGWALVIPDHEALSEAKGAWDNASTELQTIGTVKSQVDFDDDTWSADSPSRQAFDKTIDQFDTELRQAYEAADGVSGGLDSVGNAAWGLMVAMMIVDISTLIIILCLLPAKLFPPTAPAAEAAQDAAAAGNGAATAGIIAGIAGLVATFAGGVLGISQAGQFSKLTIANDPGDYGSGHGEDTFVDVDLDFGSKSNQPA